jgi:hypothetical protein
MHLIIASFLAAMRLPDPFPTWWRDNFCATQPLGYELRRALPERWVRIHSLPESRRYPEDEADWEILERRHREVADWILGEDSPCWLLVPPFDARLSCFGSISLDVLDALPPFDVGDTDEPPEPFSGSPCKWDFIAFRHILRAVAMNETYAVFVSLEKSAIYAPYDGGADLILPSPGLRDSARMRFKDYLSRLESGL